MGAWNYHLFDDDSTCDALYALTEVSDTASEAEGFLDQVIVSSEDYIDYDIAACGIAAAAVIDAKLNGTDNSILTDDGDEVDGFSEAVAELSTEDALALSEKAAEAMRQVLGENCELAELWSDNEELFPLWEDCVKRIIHRLSQAR